MWQKKHRLLNKGMAILLGGALVFGCVPQTGVLVSKAAETVQDETKKAVNDDMSALRFKSDQVISDLELPTQGEKGCTISWVSSKEDVIATNGTVTRPSAGSWSGTGR